ncbi:MAG: flavodoxin family protein [Smithellaceae bacterium]|nr:flavodoxin family protein [Smithellaceae bacterium]
MKALVTYYSKTGNTEKLARTIYETIDVDKEIKPLSEVAEGGHYDIIFIGFPVQAHSVPVAAQGILNRLPAGQNIALFSTHGSLRGGHLPEQAFQHAFGLAARARVLGHFGSRGQVEDRLLDALMQKTEHAAWVEEARGAQGHPNDSDLTDARDFARSIMTRLYSISSAKEEPSA